MEITELAFGFDRIIGHYFNGPPSPSLFPSHFIRSTMNESSSFEAFVEGVRFGVKKIKVRVLGLGLGRKVL